MCRYWMGARKGQSGEVLLRSKEGWYSQIANVNPLLKGCFSPYLRHGNWTNTLKLCTNKKPQPPGIGRCIISQRSEL